MNELTQLNRVAQYEIMLLLRQGDVSGVRRIGHLEVEPLVGEQVAPGKRRNNADHLKKGRPVLPGDLHFAVHVLKELEEDPRYE
jgi:hypothetical protein